MCRLLEIKFSLQAFLEAGSSLVLEGIIVGKRGRWDGPQGIVEDVVLLGAPVAGSTKEWRRLSDVVGGRLINGYCKTDWLLKFLYRTMSAQFSIAGTAPVENTGRKKIVNINLSHIVNTCLILIFLADALALV